MDDPKRSRAHTEERERYQAGLPDYHDPLAGVGGAPPAQSALTLRLVLAIFGLVFCAAAAVACALTDVAIGVVIVLIVLAVIAAIDIAVVVYRKRRGEPG